MKNFLLWQIGLLIWAWFIFKPDGPFQDIKKYFDRNFAQINQRLDHFQP